jgi:signal peptidase I
MKFENLFWWQYKATDEREQELYRMAYSRAYKTLTVFLVCGGIFLSAYPNAVNPKLLLLALIVILAIAYIAGWTVVKNEELALQKTNPVREATQVFFTKNPVLKTMATGIGAVYIFYGITLLYWPEKVVILTIGMVVALRILLSIGAYSVTKHFEHTVRWLMIIFIPLTAIFFGRMKQRNVTGFIGAFLISLILYVAVLCEPIFVARTYVVTPFTITTDAFAPELPKGAYRFVDKRSATTIVVNDFVIIEQGRWFVARVNTIEGDTYTVQTSTEEKTVQRPEITGRVMNETSWVEAFIESQMPK